METERRRIREIAVPFFIVLALVMAGVSLAQVQTEVRQADATEALVTQIRWDITSVSFNPTTVSPGGTDSAKAEDGSQITLTGGGTFLASGENIQGVTGGGTWTAFAPNSTTAANSGTYIVTELISWEESPGSLPAAAVDRIGNSVDARSGLAVLRIRYSDGSRGVLAVSCDLPVGTPPAIFEGIVVSKGFTNFWNHGVAVANVDANRTIFHTTGPAATAGCASGATTLCLGGRFKVQVSGSNVTGFAIANTSDTGDFWFFSPNNIEVVVKVLDGRAFNNKFWVFIGSLTNVQYTATVTDTVTGAVKTYSNSQGTVGSIADTTAF